VNERFKSLFAGEYPGRLIILGRDQSGEYNVVIYAITGRSPSSQARKIIQENQGFWVRPTDSDTLSQGKEELLIYPSILFREGIAVSNGRQTNDIAHSMEHCEDALHSLISSLQKWDYEPDSPSFTPRISGCVHKGEKAALSILKRGNDGSTLRYFFGIPLIKGHGKMIATYTGKNVDPLPSFRGEPLDVELTLRTPEETAEKVYYALKPGEKDFRVAVVCVFSHVKNWKKQFSTIINRHEKDENKNG
jgi:IMP cyclohydrolase